MTKRGLLTGALVLVVALGSGCVASKETRKDADELRDALGRPSWASSVSVRTGVDGRFADVVHVTVTLQGKATPEEVTSFVGALPGTAEKAGLSYPELELVGATGGTLEITWSDTVVAAELERGVTEWFAVAHALGRTVAGTLATEGGASYVVTLPDGPLSAVHDAYDQVAPLAEPDTAWQVLATVGELRLDLSDATLPDSRQLAVWDAMTGSLAHLPSELPPLALSLHLLDRIVADLVLTAPDDTTPDTFTVAAYGDRVWPVVRPQLSALADLADPWTYSASWTPSYAPEGFNIFVSLLSDQDPIDNGDESTRWSRAAQDYVQGL